MVFIREFFFLVAPISFKLALCKQPELSFVSSLEKRWTFVLPFQSYNLTIQ